MRTAMHLMLDIETLGTRPGCAILSVGACTFSRDGIGQKFYNVSDLRTSSGSIDKNTLHWWMCQSQEAQSIFKNGVPETELFDGFTSFWRSTGSKYVWCHGATFDAPIMSAAGCSPWRYSDVRDTRTLFHLSGILPDRATGTHHNALDDAVSQARAAIASLNKLGWPSE